METNSREGYLSVLRQIFEEGMELMEKKSADYAGDNPFGNFTLSRMVGVEPERAILVRITDKISRTANLLGKEAKVEDEKIEDTVLDMMNYSAILLAYLRYKRNHE